MTRFLSMLRRIHLRIKLWNLERNIDRRWDAEASLRIDSTIVELENIK